MRQTAIDKHVYVGGFYGLEAKLCTRCDKLKELTGFRFGAHHTTDSLSSACLDCIKQADKSQYEREVARGKINGIPRGTRSRLRRLYGLTLEQFNAMRIAQGNSCAICREHPKRWHVDHDHLTNTVRALLCHGCNVGIGHFRESLATMQRAIAYLEKYR